MTDTEYVKGLQAANAVVTKMRKEQNSRPNAAMICGWLFVEISALIAKARAAAAGPGQDAVQIGRATLRRIALREHIRLGYGGVDIPNGGSCMICNSEWGADSPEVHAENCPLAVNGEEFYRENERAERTFRATK